VTGSSARGTAVEALLRRERAVVGGAVATLAVLAWLYVWEGAGMGMSALDMTTLALFPHRMPDSMAGMRMPGVTWLTVVLMWWTMMVAMMTPSAAPPLLLYGRVLRQKTAEPRPQYAAPVVLAAGYLAVWLAFSVAAAALQFAIVNAGLIGAMMLESRSAVLSGAVLIAAGAYQLTPVKLSCLHHCRGPVEFLTQHWRPGRWGAFAMGVRHGAWCVGCCWMLMALLFVGGVMNLAWIALLALLVAAEKIAPAGVLVSRLAGVALLVWGVATLAVGG
jgi:predicted metal-binding membrane protein